jgi:hypothetical protein
MSRAAKERRARRRQLAIDPVRELAHVETLRAFVATEIPSLISPEPWTRAQFNAIDEIYQDHLRDPRWPPLRVRTQSASVR